MEGELQLIVIRLLKFESDQTFEQKADFGVI